MSLISRVILHTNFSTILKKILSKFHTCENNFAGHSKWANIKHIKALKDGQRAAAFTKLSRQIRLAVQEGGSTNPANNTALRNAIDQALHKNMPMSTIQGTIKKCDQNKVRIKKYILELQALNKIYMICIVYTDNFIGLKSSISPLMKKIRGTFTDAVHLFDNTGIVEVKVDDSVKAQTKTAVDLEELCTEVAIENGAEEIEVADYENAIVNFYCNPIDVDRISEELSRKGYRIENSVHLFIPKMYTTVPEKDLKAYETFRNKLKALDGIEEVYDNLEPIEN